MTYFFFPVKRTFFPFQGAKSYLSRYEDEEFLPLFRSSEGRLTETPPNVAIMSFLSPFHLIFSPGFND